MEKLEIGELKKKAREVRIDIIRMLAEAGSGHSAGPLGMADIFTALYFNLLNHDPNNPDWEERDRFFLSNGHIAPVCYAAMAHAGYFPIAELKTLRKLGTRLQGHPERLKLPGLESTSGPLGEGLAQAGGYAYAARMDKKKFHIYCATSDGEHDTGNHWEAVLFAAKNKLDNLTQIVDRNFIQIDGNTENVLPLEPLAEKYKSFGWHTLEIDGNNMAEIIKAVEKAKMIKKKPTVIIARTVPGKGVSFMEGNYRWHGIPPGVTDLDGAPPKEKQEEKALEDLGIINND